MRPCMLIDSHHWQIMIAIIVVHSFFLSAPILFYSTINYRHHLLSHFILLPKFTICIRRDNCSLSKLRHVRWLPSSYMIVQWRFTISNKLMFNLSTVHYNLGSWWSFTIYKRGGKEQFIWPAASFWWRVHCFQLSINHAVLYLSRWHWCGLTPWSFAFFSLNYIEHWLVFVGQWPQIAI